ncbi:hypothetical protein [Corynebacterium epidermidicanis]|uniref:Glycosyl transferase family 9 n=1 Tax=Corynebacterium epidermidicanis TaxID=1050174 RepID=A0A0G3GRQ2_9CORY|nr:hypothetical protein [Corynebacterium epidermidicanis]AKK02213.1 hypothetical protein CEPID_01640 [Corynebacterium epidermidicanis]
MSPVFSKALTIVGAVVIAATWIYLVLVRPTDWENVGASSPALLTLIGYLGGTALLLAGIFPTLSARVLTLIPVALVLNMVIGQVVGSFAIPLYLDSIGTVLVAVLAGPAAGAATGALSSVVWGLLNPAALPFAAVSATVGFLAGVVKQRGGFRNIVWVVLWGALVGLVCGALAAPVAAFVYGGTAGVGTGAVVALFREMGNSLLASVTMQAFTSDPLDKAAVFAFVFLLVKALPKRVTQ